MNTQPPSLSVLLIASLVKDYVIKVIEPVTQCHLKQEDRRWTCNIIVSETCLKAERMKYNEV